MKEDYNSPERRKARFNQRLNNYGTAAILLCVVGFIGIGDDMIWELVLLKAAVVPLFVMSLGFLSSEFSSERAKTPWTAPFVEKTALYSIFFACFITIFTWSPEKTAATMLLEIALAFLAFGFVLPFVSWVVSLIGRRKGAS